MVDEGVGALAADADRGGKRGVGDCARRRRRAFGSTGLREKAPKGSSANSAPFRKSPFGVTLAGYFLGTIPIVKDNVETVLLLVVLLSVIPIVWEFIKHRRQRGAADA